MIQIIFKIVCDNCLKEKEYKKESKENFIIEFVKEGWFIENNKHFCCKECKDEYRNK